jgi:Na+/alanine symporter
MYTLSKAFSFLMICIFLLVMWGALKSDDFALGIFSLSFAALFVLLVIGITILQKESENNIL